jgi:hypothetical protein
VSVTVADNGPGLPPEELDEVFKPFYRPELARRREMAEWGSAWPFCDPALKPVTARSISGTARRTASWLKSYLLEPRPEYLSVQPTPLCFCHSHEPCNQRRLQGTCASGLTKRKWWYKIPILKIDVDYR